jgi:Flp pilus assembly protein TadG
MRETMLDRIVVWLEPRAARTAPSGTAGPAGRVLRVLGGTSRLHHRSTAGTAGSAAVEFAITAPLLVALALGAADYGDLANRQATLEAATRAGAEYARATPGDAPSWTNTKRTVTSFTSFSPAATPTVSVVCTCVDNSPAAGTTPPCPGAANPNPCAGKTNPATGLTDTRFLQYFSVSATQNFTPMLAYASFAFPPSPLSATTVTRYK